RLLLDQATNLRAHLVRGCQLPCVRGCDQCGVRWRCNDAEGQRAGELRRRQMNGRTRCRSALAELGSKNEVRRLEDRSERVLQTHCEAVSEVVVDAGRPPHVVNLEE